MKSTSQKIDRQLEDIFRDWGDEPPKHAWAVIADRRATRALEKKREKRRILLVFFSGSLLMALLLAPFLLRRQDAGAQSQENSTVAAYSPQAIPAQRNNIIRVNPNHYNEQKPLTNAHEGKHIMPADVSPGLKAPIYVKDNTYPISQQLIQLNAETEADLATASFHRFSHRFAFQAETAQLVPAHYMPLKQVPFSGIYLNIGFSSFSDKAMIVGFNESGATHKDAQSNYGQWLTAPSAGMSFQTDIFKTMGRWILQGGTSYAQTEQSVQYDYVYRDIPVTQNGRIAGYLHLPDTQASVYRMDRVNKTKIVSVSLSIGRQLISYRGWSLGGLLNVSPELFNKSNSSVLEMNRNVFVKLKDYKHGLSMPFGYFARISHKMHGMEIYLQYGQVFSSQKLRLSNADITLRKTGNRLSIGFLYPLFK